MAVLTQSWICDSALILFSIFIGIYLYVTRNFKYWTKRGVKQIAPIPFFGNFAPCIFAQKSVVDLFQEFYKYSENEPYLGFYVLDQPNLLIRDPELLKHVLIKDFNYFMNRSAKSVKSDLIGNMNIFTLNNPEWKYVRQKLTPIFTAGKLKKMLELMLEIVQDFDVYLESLKLEGKGRSVEVKDICGKFTTDLIGITAYGMKFNSLGENTLIRKVGKNIFEKTYKRYMTFLSTLMIPSFVDIFGLQIFGSGATNFLRDVFWQAIEERMKSKTSRGDLIDLLIELKKEHEESSKKVIQNFDGDILVAQAAIFFTGGYETSSTTMSFTLFELARHPEIQERLREEILDQLSKNNGKITYEMIMGSLPYLDMVISETLRMYPVLPFLNRVAEHDYQVPDRNLVIKAGTPIYVPLYAMHMDSNYFPRPNEFDPERFSDENKKSIKSNTYFPFGDGPRICIGMRLGYLQTKLGLIHLLSKYEFSPSKETIQQIKFDEYSVFIAVPNDIILNVRKISTDKK